MASLTDNIMAMENHIDRYRKALKEIANSSEQANPINLKEIAQIALSGKTSKADEVQNHGPPYSMANPSGEPVKPHPLAARFNKKGIQDDPEC